MEICNVGQMSVVGSSIGFEPRWQWVYAIIRFLPKRARNRAASFLHKRERGKAGFFPMPEPIDGLPWVGRELGPQQRATLRFDMKGLPEARKLGRAYATTAVGDTFKANRRNMRIFARQREAARLNRAPQPTTSSNSSDHDV